MEFASSATAGAVKRSIDEHGFAIVRGAIPQDVVDQYRRGLIRVYDEHRACPQGFGGFVGFDWIGRGDVTPQIFQHVTALAMRDLFARQLLDRVTRAVLGASTAAQSTFVTVSTEANSNPGITLHTDGIVQGTKDLVLTMWAPLHRCGTGIAPSLAVVDAGQAAVIDHLRAFFPGKKIPGWHSTEEWNSGAFEKEAIRKYFGEPRTPDMVPGDVVIFTNWTIHGSHVVEGRRSAAIFRQRRMTVKERIKSMIPIRRTRPR